MTEDGILKQTGFLDGPETNSLENNEENDVVVDEIIASVRFVISSPISLSYCVTQGFKSWHQVTYRYHLYSHVSAIGSSKTQ